MARNAKYDVLYSIISNGIKPNDRPIRDYIKYFQPIFQLVLSFILIVVNRIDLSDFKYLAADGTIKKAHNSPFNIIKEKDIRLLTCHYMVKELSKNEMKQLKKTARKFLEDKTRSDEEKIEILFSLERIIRLFRTSIINSK